MNLRSRIRTRLGRKRQVRAVRIHLDGKNIAKAVVPHVEARFSLEGAEALLDALNEAHFALIPFLVQAEFLHQLADLIEPRVRALMETA